PQCAAPAYPCPRLERQRGSRSSCRAPALCSCRPPAADAHAARTGEALVVPRDEVALNLLHGIERHAYDDQQTRAAEVERHLELALQQVRQYAGRPSVELSAKGEPHQSLVDV